MKPNIKILLAASLLLAPAAARAQSDSSVYNERVIVQTHYKPVVEEQNKINVPPFITDTVSTMPRNMTFDISTRRLTSLYEPSRIKAARIIGEPATRLYNNYLKLGFGNYWSPLAEVYLNSLRSPDRNYGFHVTHRSSWGTIGKAGAPEEPSPTHYGQAPFSLTDVALFGKLITRKHLQLSADLGYENDFNRYYGFSDSTLSAVLSRKRDSVEKSSYNASYNLVTANFRLKTLNTDANALGYEVGLNLADLFASYGLNEFNLNADGNIHYGFNLGSANKGVAYLRVSYSGFADRFNPTSLPLGADEGLSAALLDRDDSTGRSVLASRRHQNLYKANPYLEFLFSGFQIRAGATVALDAYTFSQGGRVHVYPDAYISKSFFKKFLSVTLAAQGDADANTWNTIRRINPYVAPNADKRATSHYDFSGRLRLNFSKKMDLTLYGAYSILNDDLSFRLSDRYLLHNVFVPVYDSLTRLKVGGNFAFVNDELLRLEVRGNYYIYHNRRTVAVGDQTRELPLFYRPPFDAAFCATVNFSDKIIGRAEFLALGRTPYAVQTAADGSDSTLCLPWRYGVNLEVEYRHNKALSFFLKADNLLFQRYFYWQNYPSCRGLFLLGLTYTIPN